SWSTEVADRFFAAGEKELPQVSYTPLDPAPVHEALKAARALIDGNGPVQVWLNRIADVIAIAADMLAAIGTPEFHRLSVRLYGSPQKDLLECDVRPLDLARMLDYALSAFQNIDVNLDADVEMSTSSTDLAARMDSILHRHFGEAAP